VIDDAPLGHIKLARKLFDAEHGHAFWNEPRVFSRFEAWVDVIQLAAFASYTYHTAHFGSIDLARGEFVASIRWLGARWKWTVKRVRTYLAACEKWAQLKAQRETAAGTVYVIVNYETYQSQGHSRGTAKGTPEGTAGAQQGHKREASKAIQAITTTPDMDAVCAHYTAVHPRRRTGPKDRAAVAKALTLGYSREDLCLAIDGNAQDEWHATRHKHELTYVLRDGKIDTFIAAGAPVRLVDASGILTPEALNRLRAS
jgi:hypothetical protein